MSSVDDSEEEEEGDADEDERPERPFEEEAEEGRLQRRLHLFQSSSVQQAIRRIWDVVPLDNHKELNMDGYIEFNLRLQKCLTEEFAIERAVDSAIGDWCEDVREGQEAMTEKEFGMFLFELASLWCGPTVSLRVYLLFLSATFIAITEARGGHTVGMRRLDAIERLPRSFFDLLSMQGWAKQSEEDTNVPEGQLLAAWYEKNLSPENERAALLQVQRQIFQVTHDMRAVLLFRSQDGRQHEEPNLLELVKQATHQLDKVVKTEARGPPALPPAPRPEGRAARTSSGAELCPRPWCPPSHSRAPGSRVQDAELEETLPALPLALPRPRRGHSAPAEPRPAERPAPVPVGRAFETRRSFGRGRGLLLAGRAALGTGAAGTSGTPRSLGAPQPADMPLVEEESELGSEEPGPLPAELGPGWHEATHVSSFLEAVEFLPPYRLPKNPAGLYRKQAEPLMRARPTAVVFEANRWQQTHSLLRGPFERTIKRLPEDTRADPGAAGPLGHPNDPVWCEMNHRLQVILKRQGRRAERRRKRRQRSKLQTGRARGPAKRNEGRELREYLDRAAAERADGIQIVPGEPGGEFLGKVHETYLQRRDRLEVQRFQVRGTGGAIVDRYGLGEELPPRPSHVVRPVYLPPPGARTEMMTF